MNNNLFFGTTLSPGCVEIGQQNRIFLNANALILYRFCETTFSAGRVKLGQIHVVEQHQERKQEVVVAVCGS